MEYTSEQIEEKFKQLPPDIQAAISSAEIGAALQTIGNKYRLHIDKIDELSDETGLVMLGFTHPKAYLGNLTKRLEVPEDLARDIVADVNEQIFKPIRDSLMALHRLEEEQKESDLAAEEAPLDKMPTVIPDKQEIVETPAPETLVPPAPETPQNPVPALNTQDMKILADSGIEIQPTSGPTVSTDEPEAVIPGKSEILDSIENPSSAKDSVSVPAGFSFVKKQSEAPTIPAPEKKLEEPVRAPATESSYVAKGLTEKTAATPLATQNIAGDPYREPIP